MTKPFLSNPYEWLTDEALSLCSPSSRGIWMLLHLHMSQSGHTAVTDTSEALARLSRCSSVAELSAALDELHRRRLMEVSRRGEVVTVVCCRLREEARRRKAAAERARRTRKAPPDQEAKAKERPADIEQRRQAVDRLNKLFRRRSTTKWSDREKRAMGKLWPIDEEEFRIIESYYTAPIPAESDYRRRDLKTLLNNWQGEVDRARAWMAKRKPASTGPDDGPQGWRLIIAEMYQGAVKSPPRDWSLVDEGTRNEIRRRLANGHKKTA